MQIIEKETITKERIIQMTEKELSNIKSKFYYNGIKDAITAIHKDICGSTDACIENEMVKRFNREGGFY